MATLSDGEFLLSLLKAVDSIYTAEIIKSTPKSSGATADAWETNIVSGNIVIHNDEFGDIVLFLEEGTKGPYEIKIKNKKALSNGDTFFGKRVIHPGIEARHFIRSVFEDKELEKKFEKVLEFQLSKISEL